jgi:hypothetical protein
LGKELQQWLAHMIIRFDRLWDKDLAFEQSLCHPPEVVDEAIFPGFYCPLLLAGLLNISSAVWVNDRNVKQGSAMLLWEEGPCTSSSSQLLRIGEPIR